MQTLLAVMHDDSELFKQFMDNASFKRWLTDTVFSLADEPATKSHMPVGGEPGCVYRGLSGQQCDRSDWHFLFDQLASLADDHGNIVPAWRFIQNSGPGVRSIAPTAGPSPQRRHGHRAGLR